MQIIIDASHEILKFDIITLILRVQWFNSNINNKKTCSYLNNAEYTDFLVWSFWKTSSFRLDVCFQMAHKIIIVLFLVLFTFSQYAYSVSTTSWAKSEFCILKSSFSKRLKQAPRKFQDPDLLNCNKNCGKAYRKICMKVKGCLCFCFASDINKCWSEFILPSRKYRKYCERTTDSNALIFFMQFQFVKLAGTQYLYVVNICLFSGRIIKNVGERNDQICKQLFWSVSLTNYTKNSLQRVRLSRGKIWFLLHSLGIEI